MNGATIVLERPGRTKTRRRILSDSINGKEPWRIFSIRGKLDYFPSKFGIILCSFRMLLTRNNNQLSSDFAYANVRVAALFLLFLRTHPFLSSTSFEMVSRARRNRYRKKSSAILLMQLALDARESPNVASEGKRRRKAGWLKRVNRGPGGVGSIKNSIHTSIRCFVGGKEAEVVREA
ncbi:hypothetical protein DBV15_00108 [Temnothorax longispinosus]|uniref:Uncharacterized protein n=1 Tax=Temnothorax longispinosus TaxID=300112 RepID=A0A4S2KDD6_9HYME|nr:hypothetical protein DBV15_00108 [Temnothorax longispinosus]